MKSKAIKKQTAKHWPLVLALDWGIQSLKYVLLRQIMGKFRVERFGRIALPVETPESLLDIAQSLHDLFLREPIFKRAKIVIGLGTEQVVVKQESFPPLSVKELKQAIYFGIQKDLGKEEEIPVVCDYVPLGPDPAVQGNSLYLCLGSSEAVVTEKTALVAQQGVIPHKVTSTAFALRNFLEFLPTPPTEAVCFLDIGAVRSTLIVYYQGQIDFIREIVLGGDDFTKAITGTIFHEGRAIQFTTKEALEFKYKYGYPLGFSEGMTFRGAPLTEVGTMMRPVVERLTGEIHRSIGFYQDKSPHKITALYLLGGGAQLKHLARILSERLGIPSSPVPFPADFKVAGGEKQEQLLKTHFLEYAPALALALESPSGGNLLPTVYRRAHQMATIQNYLNISAIGVVFVVALLSFFAWLEKSQLRETLIRAEEKAKLSESNLQRYEAVSLRKGKLVGEIQNLNTKMEQDPVVMNCLKAVSNLFPKSLTLTSVKIGHPDSLLSEEEKGKKASPQKESSPKRGEVQKQSGKVLIIEGIGKLSLPDVRIAVAQFMLDLSKTGYLTDVNLQNEMITLPIDEYAFTISATIVE